jgi:hypothetical protein
MKYFVSTHSICKKTTLLCWEHETYALISIGIVAEDGREYYAISNEPNYSNIWHSDEMVNGKLMWSVIYNLVNNDHFGIYRSLDSKKMLKNIIDLYGKPNARIANEVKEFLKGRQGVVYDDTPIEIYGYLNYTDNKAFSTISKHKIIDIISYKLYKNAEKLKEDKHVRTIEQGISMIKSSNFFPDQLRANRFNALADAKWIRDVFNYLR